MLIDKMGWMHKVLAYAVDHITMSISYVEVEGLAKLCQQIRLPNTERLSREFDLLMGMEDTELHQRLI